MTSQDIKKLARVVYDELARIDEPKRRSPGAEKRRVVAATAVTHRVVQHLRDECLTW